MGFDWVGETMPDWLDEAEFRKEEDCFARNWRTRECAEDLGVEMSDVRCEKGLVEFRSGERVIERLLWDLENGDDGGL
jgi:hypothetical protein